MVTVFGLGFVGLTTALGFAELGNIVYGIEIDKSKSDALKSGTGEIYEPVLSQKLKEHLNKCFFVIQDTKKAIDTSKYIFVCVGTPSLKNGEVDLSQIKEVVTLINNTISNNIMEDKYIIIKSTVPPGTCKNELIPLIHSDKLHIISNPEFLREGYCWTDFTNPKKIIIGANSVKDCQEVGKIYSKINAKQYFLSLNGAEFSKYLSNVFLATLISFSNEMAYAAENFGDIDIAEVFESLHEDGRLKGSGISSYIYPGCGYGGYCLPKDVAAFIAALSKQGYDSKILNNVVEINDEAAKRICSKITLTKKAPIGILGLAFKPNTDDVRCSPAATIIETLATEGYNDIYAYDPIAIKNFQRTYSFNEVKYVEAPEILIDNSELIIVVTNWESFKTLDYKDKTVIDGRYYLKRDREI